MKNFLIGIIFILSTSILPCSGLNSQTKTTVTSIESNTPPLSDRYSMRLDFMTESQVDEIIQLRKSTLHDLCQKTMGCEKRVDVVLAEGDKIQLFEDARIASVELIKIESGKKMTIAKSVTTKKESYIVVPQKITRENIESYMLLILQAGS